MPVKWLSCGSLLTSCFTYINSSNPHKCLWHICYYRSHFANGETGTEESGYTPKFTHLLRVRVKIKPQAVWTCTCNRERSCLSGVRERLSWPPVFLTAHHLKLPLMSIRLSDFFLKWILFLFKILPHGCGSQSVAPRPATSVSLQKLLEMQILHPTPRPTDSETGGQGPTTRINSLGESDTELLLSVCSVHILRMSTLVLLSHYFWKHFLTDYSYQFEGICREILGRLVERELSTLTSNA